MDHTSMSVTSTSTATAAPAMDMGNLKPYFHSETSGLHVLFEAFEVTSTGILIAAYVAVAILCWIERGLSYYMDSISYEGYGMARGAGTRFGRVVLKTVLYGIVTTLRLFYMLVTMTCHTGLFIVVVMGLTTGQLVLEFLKSST
ncbi:hypothetical protein BC938DRAFT_483169 [Jimgerdemannia flammicorona]|uniref:Copper transporter n=1 Tax=Jimgerdemannia flammicorona TaxID=994334 RepID=A0A433R097_9FUNG|nr:hypothetical protein BC938DRAFT_483169 [Jimgerdemannia flammicorona]